MMGMAFDPNKPVNVENTKKRTFESYGYLKGKLTLEQILQLPAGAEVMIVNNFHGSTEVLRFCRFQVISSAPNSAGETVYTFRTTGEGCELHSYQYNERWFAVRVC